MVENVSERYIFTANQLPQGAVSGGGRHIPNYPHI